jgi:hypothetical protein
MKVTAKRDGKEIPLSNNIVTGILLLFALSLFLAVYAGNLIGGIYCNIANRLIDSAEKQAESEQVEEKKIIPIKAVEDDESS